MAGIRKALGGNRGLSNQIPLTIKPYPMKIQNEYTALHVQKENFEKDFLHSIIKLRAVNLSGMHMMISIFIIVPAQTLPSHPTAVNK